jgi:predicted RNA-binding Zn-ribbon protein involved in translation (DUF1610 family)
MKHERLWGSHAPVADGFPFLKKSEGFLMYRCPKCNALGAYKYSRSRSGVIRMICPECPTKWVL